LKAPETISISARAPEPSHAQFRPTDIAYVIFRHKWKILFFSLCGVLAAAGIYLAEKPVYISQAKLFIRYVQESRSVSPTDSTDAIRTPDFRGDNIINSEIELITSLDLANEVAEAIGPTNIAGASVPDLAVTTATAARVVQRGIDVAAPRKSNVLQVSYRHPDPLVARNVLTNLLAGYLRMHARVHRALGVLEDLGRQAEIRGRDLNDVQSQLRELKSSLGIANLEEAKAAHSQQLAQVTQDLLTTEALLAQAKASLGYAQTNIVVSTNSPPPVAAPVQEISREKVASYENLISQLEALKRRRQELLLQYTQDSVFVKTVEDRLSSIEADRAKLEEEHPNIATYSAQVSRTTTTSPGSVRTDRADEIAKVAGLEARWATLQKQLQQIQSDRARLAAKESDITELELKRAQYEKTYRYYASAVEEARVDAALTSGRLANIYVVQSASPPARDMEKLKKLLLSVLAGGFALGIGLALVLEFYGDQTLRRPAQIARSLNIPVFLTVPRLRLSKPNFQPKALLAHANNGEGTDAEANEAVGIEEETGLHTSPLSAYAEALRDRLIMHFQIRELHHKPKLVGVTSCGKNAGASTMATHLAASLSETGEGNVLYVDANPHIGPSVQAFYRGRQASGIASVLDQEARESAKVSNNLYVAALNDAPIPGKVGVLPKKLANLLPKIKASDFDYIIFDLPPVTQTSATARVAGLLDMTLLVLESEKTHGELAKQVTGLLKQSRADVAAVVNKHVRYVPKRLDSDL